MLNLRHILQHGLDLNANVMYVVSITVKTKSLSNKLKIFSCFNVNPLLHNALLLSLLLLFNLDLIRFTMVYYFFIFVNFKLIFQEQIKTE